jgi:ferredoxin-type protein NapH
MKLRYARWITLAAVFIIVTVGLVMNTSLGTLSSFGWQVVATICPLGAIESVLASKTFVPRALIVLAVVVVLTVLVGKAFCAWVCPVAPIRSLRNLIAKRRRSKVATVDRRETNGADCSRSCSQCSTQRAKLDSRHWILAGSLLSAAIFGFPVFCLICPIGLIFGTIIVVWQFIGFDDVSLSLLIYPAVLLIELLVLRKWCAKFCPLGALLSLLSLPNRLLRPKVEKVKCLREQGTDCSVCRDVCPEGVDPHFAEEMNECSKCALCKEECPAQAISIPLK